MGGRGRWAVGPAAVGPKRLLAPDVSLDMILGSPSSTFANAATMSEEPLPPGAKILAPVENQEIWAAGVTYSKSKIARQEESDGGGHYDHVYEAERPELFLKASLGRTRGPREAVAIRADSDWNVPEPELGLIVNSVGAIVAYVIGNDVSSRSIEGQNPLYLPQAKVYTGSCAVGPCLVPVEDAPVMPEKMIIRLRVFRDGHTVVDDSVPISDMRRTPQELSDWLLMAQEFPSGVVLLTGTGIVPAPSFTLCAGDDVSISITGLGELNNTVAVVGKPSTLFYRKSFNN